jgi:hypothetical protein
MDLGGRLIINPDDRLIMDPDDRLITDPAGSRSFLDIFVATEKTG